MLPSPDQITTLVSSAAAVVAAATGAYVRWNRKAQRALRQERRARQLYRAALDTSLEGWAACRRIAIAAGVDPKTLPRIPRRVQVLSDAVDEPGPDDDHRDGDDDAS